MIIFKGFLFGLTLQLAVGPVFFAVLHKSIQQSLSAALAMVWGVALADTFYIILSFTGVSQLLTLPAIRPLIAYFAAIILIMFGLSYFRSAQPPSLDIQGSLEASNPHHFMEGLRLTLANPLTIVFWSCTFSGLIISRNLNYTELSLYAAGCILSTLLFLSLLCLLGKFLSHLINPRFLLILNYLVGLFLIGFACRLFATL